MTQNKMDIIEAIKWMKENPMKELISNNKGCWKYRYNTVVENFEYGVNKWEINGYFNSDIPKIRIFEKETNIKLEDIKFPNYFYFDLNILINIDKMTEEDKKTYWWYKTTEGYLRKIDYKEAWKMSFDKATKEDVKLTLKLPNFSYDIFEKITGITEQMIIDKIGELK